MTSFNLDHLPEGSVSKHSHVRSQGLNIWISWGTTFTPTLSIWKTNWKGSWCSLYYSIRQNEKQGKATRVGLDEVEVSFNSNNYDNNYYLQDKLLGTSDGPNFVLSTISLSLYTHSEVSATIMAICCSL